MPATFDGDDLIITLPAATASIDVATDLYSDWKEWFKDGANARYPLAFRGSVGGDPLTGALSAGAYFFFQNQNGWRIRPAEEDATVSFIGNLVPEDPEQPILVPTTGGYSVLINGLQPVTQFADVASFGADIADALLDLSDGVETNFTLRQAMRIILAVLAGKVTGATTSTVRFRDTPDGKNRVTATVDGTGNRSAVTYDKS